MRVNIQFDTFTGRIQLRNKRQEFEKKIKRLKGLVLCNSEKLISFSLPGEKDGSFALKFVADYVDELYNYSLLSPQERTELAVQRCKNTMQKSKKERSK